MITVLSRNSHRTGTALTVLICVVQALPVPAQDLPPDAVKRAIAAATPKSVSSAKELAGKTGGTKAVSGRKNLRAAARRAYPSSHFEKGLYLKQKNDLNGALIEFLNATKENPRLVRGFYEQALIFRERGYRKLAESSLEQALAANPNYTEARVLLATVRIEQGNFGGAVQELSKSLGLAPNPDTKKEITEKDESSGLLSMALPVILQSVHGLISPPPPAKPVVDSVAVASASASASASAAADSPSVEDLLNQAEADSKAAKKKQKGKHHRLAKNDESSNGEPKKKNKKNLLTYFKRGDEMTPPGEELAQIASDNSGSSHLASRKQGRRGKRKTKDDAAVTSASAPVYETASIESLTRTESLTHNERDPLAAAGITAAAKAEQNVAASEAGRQTATTNNEPPNSIFGSATTFNAPQRAVPTSSILGSLFTSSPSNADATTSAAQSAKLVKLDDDEWAKKLKYYVDHGANSLKNGEAFMFAEDTGEASLFLADGTAIRRIVAQPKDASDVMRERRPDIAANTDDMLYGLSLLGKLIPKMDTSQPSAAPQPSPEPIGSFRGDNLMSNSQSFWGWLKTVLKF